MNSKQRTLLVWIPMILLGLICVISSQTGRWMLVSLGVGVVMLGVWYGIMAFAGVAE